MVTCNALGMSVYLWRLCEPRIVSTTGAIAHFEIEGCCELIEAVEVDGPQSPYRSYSTGIRNWGCETGARSSKTRAVVGAGLPSLYFTSIPGVTSEGNCVETKRYGMERLASLIGAMTEAVLLA